MGEEHVETGRGGVRPSDLGFGPEFPDYRVNPRNQQPVQWEAIEFAALSDARFIGISVPTGVGKSLAAASIHKLTCLRTVTLTATRALQAQYKKDFERYGLFDIQGRSNYSCLEWDNLDCRSGASMGCPACQGKGCTYERERDVAREEEWVSTNYAYWMTANDRGEGLCRTKKQVEAGAEANPVRLLILDEAHEADKWLENYLSVAVFEKEIEKYADPKRLGEGLSVWKELSGQAVQDLEDRIADEKLEVLKKGKRVVRRHLQKLHELEAAMEKLSRVLKMGDEWVVEKFEGTRRGRMWKFDLVWPGKYAEKYLFCGVEKVVFMSATLRPQTLHRLGVKKGEYEFQEWERIFPANRHPIYSIPAVKEGRDGKRVEIRIDRRTQEGDYKVWMAHIDRIIAARLDRKGLIQSVSYDRQKYIIDNSRFSHLMLGNTADPDSASAVEVAENFRQADPPAILVSPSFSMGWDFPDVECEYIIICKVPFKPGHSKVMKQREARDKSYGSYNAMQELVQSAGRGMRSEGDRCEVMVTDGHVTWFMHVNKHLAPNWFANAVRKVVEIPKPPEKL
jgi:Rad3-related DNA helicase